MSLTHKVLAMALSMTVLSAFTPAMAKDEARCSSANSRASYTSSQYQADRTAYDYCTRYGDTSGSGYGSKDCSSAYSRMNSSKSAYDSAVSEQWAYCY